MKNTQRKISKINRIVNAWEAGAPNATFGGMTLEQFKQLVKPATDSNDRVNFLLTEAVGEKKRLVDNGNGCIGVAKRAVNGLLADPNFGDDCPLYAAMGYTRKSDRKSGLTRKGQTPAPATEGGK